MDDAPGHARSPGGQVTLRYWASAKAAAGTAEERLSVDGPVSVASLVERAVAARDGSPRLARVLSCCSVLVGDRPVSGADASARIVVPGDTVEFLPPFAGG